MGRVIKKGEHYWTMSSIPASSDFCLDDSDTKCRPEKVILDLSEPLKPVDESELVDGRTYLIKAKMDSTKPSGKDYVYLVDGDGVPFISPKSDIVAVLPKFEPEDKSELEQLR